MMKEPKGFLFDLNGTMIDDMQYHIKAWFNILNGLGANLTMERMKEECYGKNGELLERIFPQRFSEEEKNRMSIEKETAYQNEFRPNLKLVNGLEAFLRHYHDKGVKMAIGSAAIMFNIDFVLDGLNIRPFFDALISADEVNKSKPDPETFLKAAAALGLSSKECIVFEDNPNGVAAARAAGMKVVVITTMHEPGEFEAYDNIIAFKKDFMDLHLG
jgi:beta-phosphoglucomutase